MSQLFERDKSVISRHIKNAMMEELELSPTIAKFATVQNERNSIVKRDIEYYNLDVIISVSYRAKSKNGILFRKWDNKILKTIGNYSKVLNLLDNYEHKKIS